MKHNFYQAIRMMLNVVIEKVLPPTITARTLFILPSTVSVGLSTVVKTCLLENYKLKYKHPVLELNSKQIDRLISYLTIKSLELINRDYHSKNINLYINNNQVTIDFIDQQDLQNIVYEMTYYYNQRNKDGWKKANKQIKLPNNNYIMVNLPLNPDNFVDTESWCPLQGQKMLGARWGDVTSILSSKEIAHIDNYLDNKIKHIDIKSESKYVLDQSLKLTDKEKIIAEFWAGIGGSVTPPGFFNMFLYGYFKNRDESNRKCDESNRTQLEYFYKLNTGLFQASIIVWNAKYRNLQCRPIQSIRINYPDIPIDYYFGESNTSIWKPYQEKRLWTPPFPDYISGHSTFSSVASCILTKLLGSNVSGLDIKLSKEEMMLLSPIFSSNKFESMDISNIVVSPDSSKIQKNVPSSQISLNFNSWEPMAQSAGISRIYGGIHYPSSNTIALKVGKMICEKLF